MSQPRLLVVIGANGAGKTTWTRKHRDRIPRHFYDADSIAGGLGDANDPGQQAEARAIIDRQIAQRLRSRETFGFESTWSGRSRPAIVRRAKEQDYEVHAVFVGTDEVGINVERVRQRVLEGGHDVPTAEVERRWRAVQENLIEHRRWFDRIEILDNSMSAPRTVLTIEGGHVRVSSCVPLWAERLARRAGWLCRNDQSVHRGPATAKPSHEQAPGYTHPARRGQDR